MIQYLYMDPAMGNWSENQVFKIPVSHLFTLLLNLYFLLLPFNRTRCFVGKKKKEFFKLSLHFVCPEIWRIPVVAAGIPWNGGNCCPWSWEVREGVTLEIPMDSRWDVGLTHRSSNSWGIPSTAPGIPRREPQAPSRDLWLMVSHWDNDTPKNTNPNPNASLFHPNPALAQCSAPGLLGTSPMNVFPESDCKKFLLPHQNSP